MLQTNVACCWNCTPEICSLPRGRKEEGSKVDHKRKDEIDELKVQKQRLQKDVDSLFKSADDLADKAEKSHSVTCINKSNSLRHSARKSFRDSRTRTAG